MQLIRKAFSYIASLLIVIIKKLFSLFTSFLHFVHRKKRYYLPLYFFLGYVILVFLMIQFSGDADFDKVLTNKRVNDVTQINPIHVNKEIRPLEIQEIVNSIQSTSGPISIGGGRYSMGGQTGYENSLHIDMRSFNKVIKLDTAVKQVTVQPGIIWRDLQKIIDPFNLSIKIMQTYANFTVGGSLSVNCHGRYIGHGPIISSVEQIKVVNAYGEIIIANRTENTDIFNAAIGGYGGIGVIVEATLQLEDNVKVERQTKLVDVKDYKTFFDTNIKNNKGVIFQNGDLYPPNYDLVQNVSWIQTDKELTDTTRVTPENENYWLEPKLVEVVSWGSMGKWLRKKVVDPLFYSADKVVWRNKEASYDVRELEPASRERSTYVLQEYFIPVGNISSFIPKMKSIYDKYDVNIINVSLRHAYSDHESFLSWARQEVFAFVIYYKQGTDDPSKEIVKQWTVEMTDAILSENGAWYLPYQPHASIEQFNKGFPNADKYFAIKNEQDSTHRFTNKLLDKYNPYVQQKIEKKREDIKGYYREEEQSILTVPEWYLVFNPKEYADYLKAGKNPSDFPYYASIDEYWTLYDRSKKLVSKAYPVNKEYNLMLQVIGVSITMEYTLKILYEKTIGRFFSWFGKETISDEEKVIIEAHGAYSDFLYHEVWYEFDFMFWVKKVWSTSNTADSNWLRKIERKLFFTGEFMAKIVYAKLIAWGANTSYGEPITEIFSLVNTQDTIPTSDEVKILHTEGDKKIVSITRWGPFTTNLIQLAEKDITFSEIGGNDEIVVSIITDKNKDFNLGLGEVLYESKMVTDETLKRLVCLVPVKQLTLFLSKVKQTNTTIEHIYDY